MDTQQNGQSRPSVLTRSIVVLVFVIILALLIITGIIGAACADFEFHGTYSSQQARDNFANLSLTKCLTSLGLPALFLFPACAVVVGYLRAKSQRTCRVCIVAAALIALSLGVMMGFNMMIIFFLAVLSLPDALVGLAERILGDRSFSGEAISDSLCVLGWVAVGLWQWLWATLLCLEIRRHMANKRLEASVAGAPQPQS